MSSDFQINKNSWSKWRVADYVTTKYATLAEGLFWAETDEEAEARRGSFPLLFA